MHVVSPLDDERFGTGACEDERGEESGGSAADDDGTLSSGVEGRICGRFVGHGGLEIAGCPVRRIEQLHLERVIGDHDLGGHDEMDVPSAAGIDAAA